MVLAALWGGSFVFMRVAVPVLGPVVLAFVRVDVAALALLALAYAQRRFPPFRTRWRDFAVVGIVNSALPFLLFSYAQQYVTASTGAILNATSPFFGAVAAAIWLDEPLTGRKLAGMALGFAGVAVLVGWHPDAMTRDTALAIAACLAAAVCYALGGTFAKRRLKGVHPSPSRRRARSRRRWRWPRRCRSRASRAVTALVVANVAALALASTAVAYLIYFRLIADIGPSRALTVTFLIPLFGVLWGFLFLGEALTPGMAVGGALIVVGTIVTLRRQ